MISQNDLTKHKIYLHAATQAQEMDRHQVHQIWDHYLQELKKSLTNSLHTKASCDSQSTADVNDDLMHVWQQLRQAEIRYRYSVKHARDAQRRYEDVQEQYELCQR